MFHPAKTLLPILLLIGLSTGIAFAAPDKNISVGQSIADQIGVTMQEDPKADGGSYWRVRNDFQIFIAPDVPRGEIRRAVMLEPEEEKANKPGRDTVVVGLGLPYLVKVGQIKSIRYTLRTPTATPAGVNLSLRIYTARDSDPTLKTNDGAFFQRRLISEPLYIKDYKAQIPDGRWGTAATDHAVSPLLWYDYPRTPAGFVTAPTLAQLQNADYEQTWQDFSPQAKGSVPTDSCAMAESVVKYISVMTYHNEGSWKDFKGDLDSIRIELVTGESFLVDLGAKEGTTEAVSDNSLVITAGTVLIVFLVVVFLVEKKRRAREAARIAVGS